MSHQATKRFAVFATAAVRVLVVLAAMCIFAGLAMADEIRLLRHANLPAGPVMLSQIATLDGQEALKFADLQLTTLKDKPVSISLGELRTMLDDKQVNWGKISLRGFMTCRITLQAEKQIASELAEEDASASGSIAANPAASVDTQTTMTLRDLVTRKLIEHAGHDAADLRITFSQLHREALNQSVLADRWELEPITQGKLGRVLVTIRQWRGQQIIQTHRVTADVSLRSLVVVVKHDVSRNDILTHDDVKIEEVYLDSDRTQPLTELASAIGQAASSTLRAGQVISAGDVAKPMLIRRGDRLVVHVIVGGMVVRTTARALDQGAMGDVISVANMDSNERFAVRITGQRQAVLASTPEETDKEKKS